MHSRTTVEPYRGEVAERLTVLLKERLNLGSQPR